MCAHTLTQSTAGDALVRKQGEKGTYTLSLTHAS